jgi:prepilin-type N-terminal cleavage/methylation domain-containing protein
LQLPPPDVLERNRNKRFTKSTYKNSGFTLAEVLIALVVIGIIAAITVPTLIQRYQDQAIKSALKKNYSVLKSALDKYQVDNGERLLSTDMKMRQLKSKIISYFNVSKDCGDADCYYSTNKDLYNTYNNKRNINYTNFDDGQFILQDGTFVMIENPDNGNNYTANKYISVDVNGINKKPNRLGKDLFMFQLTNKGELLPMGAKGTDYYSETDEYCSNISTSNMNGAGCTAKVLRD